MKAFPPRLFRNLLRHCPRGTPKLSRQYFTQYCLRNLGVTHGQWHQNLLVTFTAGMPYLLHGPVENFIGDFHPIFVHFPIVFFTLTLFSDILYYLGRDYALKLGAIFLWMGTVFSLPTLVTGWEASERFPAGDPDVTKHMLLAFTLASFAALYSIFRIFVWRRDWTFPPFVFIGLSLILTTLTSWTSDRGGVLSHGQTPFSQKTVQQ